MSKKDFIARLLKEVQPRWPLPTSFKKSRALVEHGVVLILMRHMTQSQAEASLGSLSEAYEDWNETRISQTQELVGHMKIGARKDKAELDRVKAQAAGALKEYLQEVFQQTHGLDLEFMREDIAGAAKIMSDMPVLGWTAGSCLLWLADNETVPLHQGLVRFLDKLGLITRTASLKKAASMVEPLIPEGESLAFTVAMHESIARWNDADHPIFAEVEVLRKCAFGKKAFDDWKTARARQEAQAKKEAERQAAQERKDTLAREREEAKERKQLEAETRRKEREMEKKRREHDRRLAAEAKKVAAKKAIADKKAAALKLIADKKIAAKKEAARKEAAAKKAAAKKATPKTSGAKKTNSKKPAAPRKPTRKPGASKKAVTRKPTAKKSPVKKTAKKPSLKKKAAKKTATRKGTVKKSPTRKASKKPAVKKRVTSRRR